jgi:membrane protease YdiL (CAAX protease family)
MMMKEEIGNSQVHPAKAVQHLRESLRERLLWCIFAPRHIFLTAVAIIIFSGRWRALTGQLLQGEFLFFGLAGGVLLYLVSFSVVRLRVFAPANYLRAISRSLGGSRPPLRRIATLGARALFEEAFWRGTVQVLLGNDWLSIAAVSALFTAQHLYYSHINARTMHRRVLAEFFLFSLVMGATYFATDQLLLVVGLHWMRNVLILGGCAPRLNTSADRSTRPV